MRCADVMKRDVRWIGTDDTVLAAALEMRKARLGFLPVCDDSGKVVGTITDRDIAIRLVAVNRNAAATRVSEIMTHEVVAVHPADDLNVAEQLMGRTKKSRLVCANDGGRIMGVISLSDIAARDQKHAARTMSQVCSRERAGAA